MSGPAETKAGSRRRWPDSGATARGKPLGGNHNQYIVPLLALAGLLALTAGLWQFAGLERAGDPLPQVSSERALVVSRRIGVAFDDVELTWSNWFRSKGLDAPRAAELVLFSNARPTPCSGTSPVGGPFYCPLDQRASYDLALMGELETRMTHDAGHGTALVVARVHAQHVQEALNVPPQAAAADRGSIGRQRTLHADCLTGVWAGLARSRIGPIVPGVYAEVLTLGNLLTTMHVNGGKPDQPALDIFLLNDFAAREAAFRQGLHARDAYACSPPN